MVATSVHVLFEEIAASKPDAVAVVCGEQGLTYEQLNAAANQVAWRLRELGVGPDTLVGLCADRSTQLIVGLLGVLKAGGAYVPLDPEYPQPRLAFMLKDAQALVLLTQAHLRERLPETGAPVIAIDATDWSGMPTVNPPLTAGQSHLAYVIYTSGSSGRPKGVMIEHRGLSNYVDWARRLFDEGEAVDSLLHSSFSFDFSVTSIYVPLVTGGVLALAPAQFAMEGLVQLVEGYCPRLLRLTPTHIEAMVGLVQRPLRCNPVLVVGGEVLRVYHLMQVRQIFAGSVIYNHYGPTEAVVGRCVQRIDVESFLQDPMYLPHHPVPVGQPIPNTSIAFLPSVGSGPGENELLLGGTGLARGYLNLPHMTAERFQAAPEQGQGVFYNTGDLARLDDQGRLVVVGRVDQQVKVRGHRVELGEVEDQLRCLEGVSAACVLQRPQDSKLTAFLVADHHMQLTGEGVREAIAQALPQYLIPSEVLFIDRLPLTANSKLDRQALIARMVERNDKPAQPSPPRRTAEEFPDKQHSPEESVKRVCQEVLGLDTMQATDNFLALGGDSISAMRVAVVCRRLGINITSTDILVAADISELVRDLTTSVGDDAAPERTQVGAFAATTPTQDWFFRLELQNRNVFNQSVVIEVPLDIDTARLGTALAKTAARHQAFNVTFDVRDDTWIQRTGQGRVVALDESYLDLPSDAVLRSALRQMDNELNLHDGPLWRAVLFRDEAGLCPPKLAIVAHHLVVDTVSWQILVEELRYFYAALGDASLGRKQLPVAYRCLDWASLLEERRAAGLHASEKDYWLDQLIDSMHLTRVLGDAGCYGESRSVESMLDAETTSLVRAHAASQGWRSDVPLLSAVSRAMARHFQLTHITVSLESHGRVEQWAGPSLSSGVGWFTSIYPQRIAADLPEANLHVQLGNVPSLGLGFGLLFPAVPAAQGLASKEVSYPPVSFNFLGEMRSEPKLDGGQWSVTDWWRWVRDPAGRRPYALDIAGAVIDDCLQTRITYGPQDTAASLQGVLDCTMQYLRDMVGVSW